MIKGKFSIISKKDITSQQISKEIKEFLLENEMIEDEENPNYIFVVGGDGTVLRAFRKYTNIVNKVEFLSIHTGHLGFYTDYQLSEYKNIFFDIKTKQPRKETYPLLKVKAYSKDGKVLFENYALNEVTFNNVAGYTYISDVYINDELFEKFRGDGLCISTPTGSTAYNKSLDGAVVHPSLDIFQVATIASLNNLVYRTLSNAMILTKNEKLTIVPKKQEHHHLLSMDKNFSTAKTLYKIEVTLSKSKRISFLRYNNISFWQRVKRSFIGE